MPDTGDFVTAGHLGGFVYGGDPETTYPELWQWFVNEFRIRSVLDVGSGDGCALRHFREYGCDPVWGVDGVPQRDPDILQHDYQLGPYVPERMFDLIWCCEFVEHVEEQYIPNFLATFEKGRIVALTHALPGQPGWHHVNCQPPEYWIDKMATIGRYPVASMTTDARNIAHGYFAATGRIFA